ncbi:hypothetical protein N9P21_02585, partial [Rhodobacteraceae bacterium]|nr:hypothetical protein [Paracoccaceae bacterium]
GKKSTTYREYSVSHVGVVSKKSTKLTSLQLVSKEADYNADLNQDGEIGLRPVGTQIDYGEGGGASVYAINGVGHGILADDATHLTALTTSKGKAWSGSPIGVDTSLSGYSLIVETVGKKSMTYREHTVSDFGVVSKKGAKLTSIQLVSKETEYNSDLNQDGEIGFLPFGSRVDYGLQGSELHAISGVGYGLLADGETFLKPLTTSKGIAWSGDPIGVNNATLGYTMIVETVGKKSTTYREYTVSEAGVVSKKGMKLTFDDLLELESIYKADFNHDGMSGSIPIEQINPVPIPMFGNVIKGPLKNAVVFADEDGDGVQGPNESSAITNSGGYFMLNTLSASTKIVVKTNDNTIDTSSGKVLSGVTLSAPAGSSVISPASTILESQPDIKPEQLALALGVPTTAADGSPIDLLDFNPFSPYADPDVALAIEKASQQLMVTVKAVSAAAEGAGMPVEQAFEQAMESVSEAVSAKAKTIDVSSPTVIAAAESALTSGESTKIDFSDSNFLDAISEGVKAKVSKVASEDTMITIDETAFATVLDTAMSAVSNVVLAIESIIDTDLTALASQGIFSTLSDISSEIKLAAEAEVVSPGSAAALITFTDVAAVMAAANSVSTGTKPQLVVSDGEGETAVGSDVEEVSESDDGDTVAATESGSVTVAVAGAGAVVGGGSSGADDLEPLSTDQLMGSFNDVTKMVTVSGVDTDLIVSDVSFEIFDNALSSIDPNYNFSISPKFEVKEDGTALISYNDINRSIQDLAVSHQHIDFKNYESMRVQYENKRDSIENPGDGSFLIEPTLFQVLGVSSKVENGNNVLVELRSELGWDYSRNDIELATLHISFNSAEVNFVHADLQGILTAYNDTSIGLAGKVEAGMAQLGDVYSRDGGLFGTFEFLKTTEDPTLLEVQVYEIGSNNSFDYPVGFTIEI